MGFFKKVQLHPLPLDLLDFLLPLFLGALAFAFGRFSFRLLKPYRYALVVLSIGTIAIVGLSFTDILPQEISTFLFWIGGATIVLGWMALLLLGIVWTVPGRSVSSAGKTHFSLPNYWLALDYVKCTSLRFSSESLGNEYHGGEAWPQLPSASSVIYV